MNKYIKNLKLKKQIIRKKKGGEKKKTNGRITRPSLIGRAVPRVCPGSESGGLMCVWSAGICR